MFSQLTQLVDNIHRVRSRIAAAASRVGRDPSEVRLVAVTKYVDADVIRAMVEAGCHVLGESRPQQFWTKADLLADLDIQWHFIGHLQRNKLARTLPRVTMLQSVDSERLLDAVGQWAEDAKQQLPILIEINISGDSAKHGFAPDQTAAAVRRALACPAIRVDGLMAMASLHGGLSQARIDFRGLRQLRDTVRAAIGDTAALPELSMGMSDDFEVAIEEGATIVRVGSLLYEGLLGD